MPVRSHPLPSTARRRPLWQARLALLAASGLFGLLILEGGLRLLGLPRAILSYQPDDVLGARLVPGDSAWQTNEGQVFVRINSHGFRDRERTLAKPANGFRVAVLGDSYVEAVQVELEETFWSVMERQLQQCSALAGREVEVLGFGCSGYGTAQELLLLQQVVWEYDPDVVLLAFLAGNDVRNNSRVLEEDDVRPYFVLDHGRLVLDDQFRRDPDRQPIRRRWLALKHFLVKRSRICGMIYHLRNPVVAAPIHGDEAGLDMLAYREPTDPDWEDAWNVTDALVRAMSQEVHARGARFSVLMIPSGVDVDPDDARRERVQRQLGVEDLEYPERRLSALGEEQDFPVIPLIQPLRTIAREQGLHLHGFPNTAPGTGHWNADGHRIAGEIAAREICDQLLNRRESRLPQSGK